jgi:hypothetical protein
MNSKFISTLAVIPLLLMIIPSLVAAKNVALAVMNASNLDAIHEQPIYDILKFMNETVTVVDQNSNVNWSNFDLIVVAGRPPSAAPLPSSFAQNIPVNSIPTIGIDFYNLYPWGWVKNGGANNIISGGKQVIIINSNNHPITAGYSSGQIVYAQNQSVFSNVDMTAGTSNFTYVANLDQQGDGGISFAAPNTLLANGKSISSNSAAIFIGVLSPAYWTQDTVNIFKNAVNWITNINYVAPTTPVLSGPGTSITSSAAYIWSVSSGPNGIQGYEVQISLSPDFKQIIVDTQTSSLSYTLNGMNDGQKYFVRVRAIDFLNLKSPWSNTITTVADFAPIILTIISPASGSDLPVGQTAAINVSVSSPRLQNSVCAFYIDQNLIGTLQVNLTIMSCSGSITIPQLTSGPTSTNFNVSVTDIFGGTNSTSIPITVSNRQTSSSATTSATAPVQTSSSGSSDGGSYYYSILSVTTPTNETFYTNSQNSFTITVRNDGNQAVRAVKIWATSSNLSVSVSPAGTYDFNAGEQKTYTVNVQTSVAGNYNLVIRTLSYETTETAKTIPILVTEKPIIVDIGITNIEIPDFAEGTTSLTNITLINKGNVAGTANVNLALPDGWTASSSTASVDLQPNQQATLAFEITPSTTSGNLTFSGIFSAANTTKSFSYPTEVSAKSNPNSLAGITGALATIFENPTILVPTIIAAGVLFTLYYKFRTVESFSKYVWPKGVKSFTSVAPKSHQKNNFTAKKPFPSVASHSKNNAYEKWERSR